MLEISKMLGLKAMESDSSTMDESLLGLSSKEG